MAKFSDLPVIESLDIFLDEDDRAQRAGVADRMEKELKAVTFSKEFVDAANGIIAAGDRVAKLDDQHTGRRYKMEAMTQQLATMNEEMSAALDAGDDPKVEKIVAEMLKLEGERDRMKPVVELLESRTIPAAKQDQAKAVEDFKAVARVEFSNIYDRKRKSLMAAAEKLNGESFAFKLALEDVILTLGLKLGEFTETIHPMGPVAGQRLEVPLNKELAPVEGDHLGLGNQV
jgi:hypothetical protein